MLLWVVITCRPLVMEQSCAEHFILFIKSSCLFCDGWGSWDRETKVTLLGDTAWICSQVSQVPNFAYHPWVSDMGRVWVPSFHFCFLQNSFFLKKYSLHLFVHPGERSPEPSFLCAVVLTPKAKGRGGCIKIHAPDSCACDHIRTLPLHGPLAVLPRASVACKGCGLWGQKSQQVGLCCFLKAHYPRKGSKNQACSDYSRLQLKAFCRLFKIIPFKPRNVRRMKTQNHHTRVYLSSEVK